MKDIKNCVVSVHVNGERRGTGYIVSKQLILTCAHVLTDDETPPTGKVKVKFHCGGEEAKEIAVSVSKDWWSPASKYDVAVLKLNARTKLPACVELASLASSIGRKGSECEVFGYPILGEMNGLAGRARIIDEIRQSDGRKLIQLQSTEATCGFSGSPLFDPKTKEVIGTFVEIATAAGARYSPDLYSRLDDVAFATPMSVIVSIVPTLVIDSEADIESRQKIRDRVKKEIRQILGDHPEALKFLERTVNGIEKLNADAKQEAVVNHLLTISLSDFIPCVMKGYVEHAKSNPNTATAFRELALYTFPQIYKPEVLAAFHRSLSNGGNYIVIETSHKSIIELVIAGVTGQKIAFNDDWNFKGGIPAGKRQVPLVAEFGILDGKMREQAMKSFERELINKIGGLAADMPDPTKAINRKLAKLKAGDPPIRYYYVYGTTPGRIEELESRYPDVVFFWHEQTDHDDTEFDILDGIKDMFCPESER